jgi:CRISPR-associated protein Csd2
MANNGINARYDFVLLFDVQDGNPNGDPDAGNLPRIDPETGHGLVTDVCLKRKVRNYVALAKRDDKGNPASGYDIYVKERGILANEQKRAYQTIGETEGSDSPNLRARGWMMKTFFDVRCFGAVMTTGKTEEEKPTARGSGGKNKKLWNCGQVRGPVQLTFARSIDPIVALEHSITRVALTNASDTDRSSVDPDSGEEKAGSGQMGRKSTIPYGLYRAHGFVSPQLAADTGFSEGDLTLLWQALANMFESDRSAARGLMSARHLIVFKHESPLGDAPAHRLFERVSVTRKKTPARQFADYEVLLDGKPLAGEELRKEVAAKS